MTMLVQGPEEYYFWSIIIKYVRLLRTILSPNRFRANVLKNTLTIRLVSNSVNKISDFVGIYDMGKFFDAWNIGHRDSLYNGGKKWN